VIDLDAVIGHIIGLRSRGQDADGNERFDFEKVSSPSGHEIDTAPKDSGVESPDSIKNMTER